MTVVVGLTGGIAAGKSTLGDLLRRRDVPVLEADRVVEELYAPGGKAASRMMDICPESVDESGGVNRVVLSAALRRDRYLLQRVEEAVHPLVEEVRREFVDLHRREGRPIVVVDVPLLFETGAENQVDAVILARADRHIREKRALKRPGMTREKLDMILARQWTDEAKAKHADYVINTGGDISEAEMQLDIVLADIVNQGMKPCPKKTT